MFCGVLPRRRTVQDFSKENTLQTCNYIRKPDAGKRNTAKKAETYAQESEKRTVENSPQERQIFASPFPLNNSSNSQLPLRAGYALCAQQHCFLVRHWSCTVFCALSSLCSEALPATILC